MKKHILLIADTESTSSIRALLEALIDPEDTDLIVLTNKDNPEESVGITLRALKERLDYEPQLIAYEDTYDYNKDWPGIIGRLDVSKEQIEQEKPRYIHTNSRNRAYNTSKPRGIKTQSYLRSHRKT